MKSSVISRLYGVITAFEIKISKPRKIASFAAFQKLYTESSTKLITRENVLEELTF